MTEILLFFLLPLLLFLFLLLPILPKIAKYMSRTQVPEEDQRVSTVSDLKNYEPRPKAIIRTEGKNAPNDKLENLYWWDPDGEASNADGDEIIESNVSGYGNGGIDEGVWRRFVSPMSEARNQIDLKDSSSVTRDAGYSLLNARHTGKDFNWYAEGSNLTLARDLIFNDDGTKMFGIGSTQDVIEEFSLSDPYDISTGSFTTGINTVNDFDWSSYDGTGADPVSAQFVNGGSDLFLISQSATVKAVQKITLSTPYDLSSTTSADGGAALPTGLNSIEFHPNDGSIFFSSDAAGKVEEYSLDAGAFDLSGGVSRVNQLDISSEESGNRSFAFSGDGRAFFTTGASSNKIHKFELGPVYDITGSVELTETFDLSETMEFPEFVTFNGDGTKLFTGYTSTGKYYEWESTVSRIDVRNTLSGGDGISFDSKSGKISNKFADGNGNTKVSSDNWIGYAEGDSYLPEADSLGVGGTNHSVLRSTNNLYLSANSNGNGSDFDIIFGGGTEAPGDGNWNEEMRIQNGEVGIGKVSPSSRLDVDGNITVDNIIQKGGQLPQVYRETRSLPTTVDDYVEIGNFEINSGGHAIKVNIVVSDSGFSTPKEYILPMKYSQTSGNWREVLPISGAVYSQEDFSLQVNVDGGKASLRIRRSSGTTSGNASITMQQLGLTGDSFTAQSGTGSTSEKPLFGATVIKQEDGKVGIGTSDPSKTLDVNGTVNISKNELITQDSSSVLSVDTGTNKSLTVGTAGDTKINDGGGNFTGGNVFMGVYAGINATTTGARNTAVGYYSGWDLQDGEGNACLGASSGTYISSGKFNTMVGDSAGFNTSSGGKNTFIGAEAGHQNQLGNHNTYLGRKTGRNITGASRNIAIGHETMENASGKDIVAIGYRAGRSNTQDNQFILENKSVSTTPLIQGDFSNQQIGIGKSSPSKALDVAGQVTMDDSYIRNLSNISSDTKTSGDDFYSVDTSGGSVTLTLSSSDAETGRVIHVKRNGTQRVNIDTESSETIDGRSSAQLGSDEESVRLVYNGANSDWEVY